MVKNYTEYVTGEDFNLASTWFNGTSVTAQDSVSNEEVLDAPESNSVVSHSVTFTDPLVQDDSNNASSKISEEASTGVSEEGSSIDSEEGCSSVSKEGSSSVTE